MIKRNCAFVAAVLFAFALIFQAQAAVLLPPGLQTFTDANGLPLNGGQLFTFLPNTTTPKSTWQDSAQTTLNSNPVILDSSGRAAVFGVGAYRELLEDSLGNIIWDRYTSDPGASTVSWGALSGGTANAQTVLAPNFSSVDGQSISFIPFATNTSALSINPNTSGPIGVVEDTPSGPIGLVGGEIVANTVATLIYDGSRGVLHFSGSVAQPGSRTTLLAANTTDLGTISSRFAYVTGAATITSFGSTCSTTAPIYYAEFSGGQTIISSAKLLTPGSTNIITAAGDSAVAECLGGGNWRILSFDRASGSIPPGAVMAFNLSACPAGWGASDGTSNTADLRGVAIRGLDNGRGLDTGRALASYQADQLQSFTVPIYSPQGVVPAGSGSNSAIINPLGVTSSSPAGANVGTETRMKNVGLLYCQKL